VLVLGAGVSGLAAAARLAQAGCTVRVQWPVNPAAANEP